MKKNKIGKIKKYTNSNGVTLIALVITIIVLLILAGISIYFGYNIIAERAQIATTSYRESAKNEDNEFDEVTYYVRELNGTGSKSYDISSTNMPDFIADGSALSSQESKDSEDSGFSSINISFINYDKKLEESVYVPTEYKTLTSSQTVTLQLKADYILYVYAFANDNSSEKGDMTIKDSETQEVKCTYNLPGRKAQNVEPLQVVLRSGTYDIATDYNKTIISKIQLEPIVIKENSNSGNSGSNSETNQTPSVMTWSAEENTPDWLNIITNNGERSGDTPFTDTAITDSIKIKDGFSINLGNKKYDITLYITGSSSQRTLTLTEDSSFSQTLYKRSVTGQSPITLEDKTGTLNFKVNGESQIYKIILTEVK